MPDVLIILLIAIYAYSIVSAILVLLLENRNPVKSFSWILVLIFLPVLGLFFYLTIGQNYRKQRIISKKSIGRITDRPGAKYDIEHLLSKPNFKQYSNLISLLNNNSEGAAYSDNKIEILAQGDATFEAMFDARISILLSL